jgi:hypothetical protein
MSIYFRVQTNLFESTIDFIKLHTYVSYSLTVIYDRTLHEPSLQGLGMILARTHTTNGITTTVCFIWFTNTDQNLHIRRNDFNDSNMYYTTDSGPISTHAQNITNVAYDQKKTLVLTGSNLKSTSKRIVFEDCTHVYMYDFGRIFMYEDSVSLPGTEIHRNGNVTIIRQNNSIWICWKISCKTASTIELELE